MMAGICTLHANLFYESPLMDRDCLFALCPRLLLPTAYAIMATLPLRDYGVDIALCVMLQWCASGDTRY